MTQESIVPRRKLRYPNAAALTGAALLLAALGAARPAQAQLIQNGSFETGTFMDNGSGAESLPVGSTAIADWTVTNAELAWLKNGNPYGLAADDGNFFLDLTGYHDGTPYGGVTQSIATTSGATYHLSFAIGADESNGAFSGPVGITATAGNATQTFTFNPVGLTGNQWETVGLDFQANSSSTPITLIGAQGFQYIGLDSVSVTPAAVPEASTTVSFGLLALGLAGVVAAKRRKQSA